jgi:aspartyl aminopeptidase
VPTCHYSNRSDIAGGTTLGNTVATRLSVIGVDIGLPELAMHTAFETAGARDTEYALKVFEAFFSSHIKREKDGFMIV